jgi:trk system potassium uptake protein TrkA
MIIVCIGEDEGANILATALMKKMNVPRLISRSVSPLHATVLEAMGINEIINPEEESAERWVKKLTSNGLIDSFELTKDFSIIETIVPRKFIGKTLEQLDLAKQFNVLVLTSIKQIKERNLIGIPKKVSKVQGIATAKTIFSDGDIMVLFGRNDDIQRLLKD